jgi:hypothetical protein
MGESQQAKEADAALYHQLAGKDAWEAIGSADEGIGEARADAMRRECGEVSGMSGRADKAGQGAPKRG